MSTFSLFRSMGAVAALGAAAVPALAAPVNVDFEPGFVLLADGDAYTQDGFSFTAVGAGAVVDPIFCDPVVEFCAVGNNTSVLQALNDTQVNLTHASRVFSLGSFSASFLPSPLVDFSGANVKLRLDGVAAGGGAVSALVGLLEDGSSGNFLFGQYDGSALGNLSSLRFSVCFDNGASCGASPFLNDAQFALDNVSLNVPEPGAAAMVALALAALALTRRCAR